MKVTVCFGETRVVVPCGQGDFLVSDLIEKAVLRYKKATGKPSDCYISVHSLKSQRDGGILDLDDVLSDVVDDKEQIVADYEEQSFPTAPQGGDGTSGSSVGSSSPDVFHSNRKLIVLPNTSTASDSRAVNGAHLSSNRSTPAVLVDRSSPINKRLEARLSVEVTEHDLIAVGSGLQVLTVRRDSEPSLGSAEEESMPRSKKPWPLLAEESPPKKPVVLERHPSLSDDDDESQPGFTRFARDSTRRSLTSQNVLKWATNQERQQEELQVPQQNGRKEPLGQSHIPGEEPYSQNSVPLKPNQPDLKQLLLNEAQINRVGYNGSHDNFLKSKGIILEDQMSKLSKTDSRESLDAQKPKQYVPVHSNSTSKEGVDRQRFRKESWESQSSQDSLRGSWEGSSRKGSWEEPRGPDTRQDALAVRMEHDARIVLLKNDGGPLGIHVVPHRDQQDRECGLAIQGIEPGGRIHRDGHIHVNDVIIEINGESLLHSSFAQAQEIFREALQTREIHLKVLKNAGKVTTPSSEITREFKQGLDQLLSKKAAPLPPLRSPNTSVTSSLTSLSAPTPMVIVSPASGPLGTSSKALIQANTRKLGKKFYIDLTKGPEGLGFSITTRDNPSNGVPPIYVKNILPKGAAIADGRLASGDRLLEVNGMDMTGKSQDEAVAILRNTKRGSTVTLCVSRQESTSDLPSLPRQLEPAAAQPVEEPASDREVLLFNIPLNETGSAGLGVSVKGQTSSENGVPRDLGIFIKAVINGGAASKDGRLRINDQLLAVNDEDLQPKTNSEAMNCLRQAMHTDGPTPGHIKLCIARKPGNSNGSTPEPLENVNISGHIGSPKVNLHLDISRSENEANPSIIEMRNPVLDRLTGTNNKISARNESYHLATTDGSDKEDGYEPPNVFSSQSTIPTPTEPSSRSEVMMIEDDNQTSALLQQPRRREPEKARPASTIGVPQLEETKELSTRKSESERRSLSPPALTTQMSEEQKMNTFDREAFGRRSFSEKRKASNGKNKEVVEKVKALREELKLGQDVTGSRLQGNPELIRAGSAESLIGNSHYEQVNGPYSGDDSLFNNESVGPTLGLRKNSSLESLQGLKEGTTRSTEPSYHKPQTRVARGRGCNESFRAAVDRSYEPAAETLDNMEAVTEETEFTNGGRNTPMTSSFNSDVDSDKKKPKKQKNSLLDLFRFGKSRKSLEERSNIKLRESERQKQEVAAKATQAQQAERDRIQEHYKRLQEKQKQNATEQHRTEFGTYPRRERLPPPTGSHAFPAHAVQATSHGALHSASQGQASQAYKLTSASQVRAVPEQFTSVKPAPLTEADVRSERLANARADHQRRHIERQGRYPGEEEDDFYEQKIKQREREWDVNNKGQYGTDGFNPRPKASRDSGMYSTNRYSFYADPRYSDYQQITGNISDIYAEPTNQIQLQAASPPPSLPTYAPRSKHIAAQVSQNNNACRTYSPVPKHAQHKHTTQSAAHGSGTTQYTHQRYASYDAATTNHAGYNISSIVTDYDDPSCLYAQVRKPAVGRASPAAKV